MAPRYQAIVDIGAGCGARQGEIFGLSPGDFDFADGWLTVRRQVKRVGSHLVFGLPKNDKERQVPVPDLVAAAVRSHLDSCPPVSVTLPWEDPANGAAVTVPLMFTTLRGSAVRQQVAANQIWHPALRAAGITPNRADGMHALRHLYASVLLDAGRASKRWRSSWGSCENPRAREPGRPRDGPRPWMIYESANEGWGGWL